MVERLGESLAKIRSQIVDVGYVAAVSEALPWEGSLADTRTRRWSSVCPDRFVHATLDDIPEPLRTSLDGWGGLSNLILLGGVGVGKTHAALAVARRRFIEAGDSVKFWPVVELLDDLRPGGQAVTLDAVFDVDLLVLDDLGAEKPTDWTAERLFAVVNRRWMERAPIVGTSNLQPDELRAALGARTYSRLVGDDAVVVGLSGPDRRRA